MVPGFTNSVVCFLCLQLNATSFIFKIKTFKPDSRSDNWTHPFGVDRGVHM